MDSITGILQGFWQLNRNTYLKEHLWTAAFKQTDVIKSAVNIYESPIYKRCWVTPHFLHQDKNIYQKTICPKGQCSWSGEILKVLKSETVNAELRSFYNLCKNKLFRRSLTSKYTVIYRDSLTSTIFKRKERYALLENDLV